MPKLPTKRPPKTSDSTHLEARLTRLGELLARVVPVPDEWLEEAKMGSSGAGDALGLIYCEDYRSLINYWRKAMKWTDGLDCALSVMLAVVTSTKAIGDQLWAKIIGPASCGKSTLCEALSTNKKYVVAKSTLRGFLSGWKSEDGEDTSLLSRLRDRTFITKDGDTLLQQPNLGQILAEARDLYDRVTRSDYRNNQGRDYEGINMSWILCGTSSLRKIDSSELGERFLDCVIMEGIDDDLEDEVLWRIANRANREMRMEANGELTSQVNPELSDAMAATGGYVGYLRENAARLLASVETPEWALRKCTRLGKFVAFMRARPSNYQDENAEREFAGRLVSQHTRLMNCLAVVLNRKTVDEEVMRRVHKVALDTSRGWTLDIADRLYKADEGMEARGIALYTSHKDEETKALLRFLRKIKVVDIHEVKTARSKQQRWVLTPKFRKLYSEVRLDD